MDVRMFFSSKQSNNPAKRIKPVKIRNKGVNYLVTTNADIKDETTRRFIDSLVSSEESSDEDVCEERESLKRILKVCATVSNEITQLNLLLNRRLENM